MLAAVPPRQARSIIPGGAMPKTALFVRHKARPGRRDAVVQIWERHVRPRVAANPHHLAYHFCLDSQDQDAVCVFQLYDSEEALQAFLAGDWYPAYLDEVRTEVVAPPVLQTARQHWAKGPAS